MRSDDIFNQILEFEVFGLVTIPKAGKARDPVFTGKLLMDYSGGIHCALLFEPKYIQLVYFTYSKSLKKAGLLLANMAVGSKSDCEVYGFFEMWERSIVVYGWQICDEYTLTY